MDPRVCHKTTVTVVSLTQTTLSINGIPIFSFVGQSQLPTKYTGSDVPDQDVDDNENAVPPAPTAPPPDMFGTFAGYENANFGTEYLPPPPPYQPPPPQETPEQQFTKATAVTEDEARDALLSYVAEHCCFGKGAAKDMEIEDITPSSAYHYNISSFCESRSTSWKYEPFTGQMIDGPQNGLAPQPWDIPAQPSQLFTPQEALIEVPHTAAVKPCHECMACGFKRCYRCYGRGRVFPITMFPDQDVNSGSQTLVEAHSRNWPNKRILMQRHTLRAVPVSEVQYKWKDTKTRYWVYGLEHKVHAPDYPQQCCCGCTLL
ncbi:Protein SSUH2-like protein [Acropora cervicornis]|uniref:Protein SSUH2-like protein n=1 Tax=Acropora cervicornis TaxID=6130 RepID=A0AAD9VEI7_ACRCE|nr:Protein SSUH2-like protein [Acropora cervicornis]